MLNELHIENIAVIEKADISFRKGLNVLTGETGAGKSIVIDSIGSVLGSRVSKELVRRGAEKGLVTAVFDAAGCEDWLSENDIEADDELIIQRRISADGKSSCRVCGTPVTVSQLRELAQRLVDIHGQNDGRLLLDESRHREYLDRFGTYTDVIEDFSAAYQKYTGIKKEIDSLRMDEIEKERLSDSLRFRIEELERAQLKAGEYDELSSKRDLLRNFEKLSEAINQTLEYLYEGEENAVSMAQNASYYAQRAAALTAELESAAQNIASAEFALSDAAETIRDFRDSLNFSPEEYDRLETRLALLNKLRRKYGKDESELIEYLEQCREKLDNIQYADERTAKLEKELLAAKKQCRDKAAALGMARRETAKALSMRIQKELKELNMASVRFEVEFAPIENETGFDSHGADEIRFVMSANAGEALGRISKIASGGELSRIMLAMKNVFAENDPVATMIFDEIDTGVSGRAAQRVGEKLFSVSLGKQVMCVTHLPQIAAIADNHYLIRKEERGGRTYTEVNLLDRDGRIAELARMYGGDNVTQSTLASADEQLTLSERFKSSLSLTGE